MFGQSTPSEPPSEEERKHALTIQGIPKEFYGGANPVIHFKTTTKEVDVSTLNEIPVADTKAHEEQSATGGTNPLHPIHFFSDPKKLLLASVAVLGIAVVGASGYYVVRMRGTSSKVLPPPSISTSTAVVPVVTTPAPEVTPVVTEVIPVVLNSKLDMPSLLLGDSADDDRDLLTNQEEEIFRADPGVADTDVDSFLDAHETYFLYSPIQKEPSKLIESGTVTDYTNPTFGYQLYYPATWVAGSIDPDNRDVLFSSSGGEYVEVRVFDRPLGTTFTEWLSQVAPGERITDLARFTTRALEPSLVRQDYSVFYFETSDKIIVMVYHPISGQAEISYRTTMTMMARSFRAKDKLEPFVVSGTLRPLGERKKSFAAQPFSPSTSTSTPSSTIESSPSSTVSEIQSVSSTVVASSSVETSSSSITASTSVSEPSTSTPSSEPSSSSTTSTVENSLPSSSSSTSST